MSKRGENIHKRKDGRWEARYEKGRTSEGAIIYGFLYGKSYREAKNKKIQAIQAQLSEEKEAMILLTPDIQILAGRWLEYIQYTVKTSTYMCYTTLIQKHIIPYFQTFPEKLCQQTVLQEFYNFKIATSLSVKSAKMLVTFLQRILCYGEEHELIPSLKRPVNCAKSPIQEKKMLTEQQLSILCKYLLQDGSNFALGILLCMHTGMRIGELCGIKLSDLNFETGILTIQRTICRIRNLQTSIESLSETNAPKTVLLVSTPKSLSSRRQIPVPDHILTILRQKNLFANTYFLTGTSDYLEPRTVQRRFKRILYKCGLPPVTFHSLRHSFATKCIENGVDSKSLSEILGHSSVKITLDIYVHSNMEKKKEYMNQFVI